MSAWKHYLWNTFLGKVFPCTQCPKFGNVNACTHAGPTTERNGLLSLLVQTALISPFPIHRTSIGDWGLWWISNQMGCSKSKTFTIAFSELDWSSESTNRELSINSFRIITMVSRSNTWWYNLQLKQTCLLWHHSGWFECSKASNLIPVEPISAKFYELEFKPLHQSELFGARYGNSPRRISNILLKICG